MHHTYAAISNDCVFTCLVAYITPDILFKDSRYFIVIPAHFTVYSTKLVLKGIILLIT